MPARADQRRGMTPKQIERQARMLRMKTPPQAAEGLVWLADSAEAGQASGNWFTGPETLFPAVEMPWRTEAAAKELWERSEALVRPFIL
ncbi:unnamed protein product [Polarella glacialis]|uniref:Uncharacterized protein n=1 Tax=Polarella glacialis TaxID=89957 RepID=A0A813GH15_POLGL|nr:unnamed protein product [Polarella glacialis]